MLGVWEVITVTPEFAQLLECKDHSPVQLLSPVFMRRGPGRPEELPGDRGEGDHQLLSIQEVLRLEVGPQPPASTCQLLSKCCMFSSMESNHGGLKKGKEWIDPLIEEGAEARPQVSLHALPVLCPGPQLIPLAPRFQAAWYRVPSLLDSL